MVGFKDGHGPALPISHLYNGGVSTGVSSEDDVHGISSEDDVQLPGAVHIIMSWIR